MTPILLGTIFAALLGALALFQLALVFGAPWGRFVWGGQHEGRLPRNLRIGSIASIMLYALFAIVALDRVGAIIVFPGGFSNVGMWVIFAFLCLGTLMNLISRSKPERITMTPVAAILALLALGIAFSGTATHTYTGLVLDTGQGPAFCTGLVLESAPPQCGGDLVPVSGWNWESVEHVDYGRARWGEYMFTGIRDGAQIEFVELATP